MDIAGIGQWLTDLTLGVWYIIVSTFELVSKVIWAPFAYFGNLLYWMIAGFFTVPPVKDVALSNSQSFSLVMSIPMVSTIITILGCLIVVAGGVTLIKRLKP